MNELNDTSGWNCEACTYLNSVDSNLCEMCDSREAQERRWSCSENTLDNAGSRQSCAACGASAIVSLEDQVSAYSDSDQLSSEHVVGREEKADTGSAIVDKVVQELVEQVAIAEVALQATTSLHVVQFEFLLLILLLWFNF